MTYQELIQIAYRFYPSIALERIFSRKKRSLALKLLFFPTALAGAVALAGIFGSLSTRIVELIPQIEVVVRFASAVFFILVPFWALVFALHSFVNSYYFSGFDHIGTISEKVPSRGPRVSYELAMFFYYANPEDITGSFIAFPYGQYIFERAGISRGELSQFLTDRKSRLTAAGFSLSPTEQGAIRVYDLALAVFREDTELAQLLFTHGVQEKSFLEAAAWVSRDMLSYKKRLRWWSRDRLGRIEGIAKDWSYGTAFRLRQYAHELTSVDLPSLSSKPKFIQQDVERLEAALSRTRESNAILVGEDGGSKHEVLLGLASLIEEGAAFPALEHKKLYRFDANRFISATQEKAKFEFEFLKLLDESVAAGNVIMAIDDFTAFLESATRLGVNVSGLMSQYLSSSAVQFICLSSPTPFHQILEPDATMMSKFDVILLHEGEALDILQVLQDEASLMEGRYGLIIPQPILSLIAESADRYVTEGVMPDKAINLLHEVSAKSAQLGMKTIDRTDVLEFVKAKTGIPTGVVSSEEKEKLVRLEELLHQRVIGQNEAVTAIANAMRRSRAGVSSPNRPIGSFLFMGPTGVGKTETTKALAQAFFGDENRILRLDMSEYKGGDALPKLIGSFGSNSTGVLSSMLREKPYGVLLLDEFEKANKDVMDLFLQVLDEGNFSDMRGKKVNARNTIIIATSNAGSDLIYDAVQEGKNLTEKKSEIIDSIVQSGIFRPELLNRFDGVILFQPIEASRLREIAKLMLERFRGRIRGRGIDLEITDDLVDYLMKFGSDPKFGARPMNRAIQDVVEQKIADKIIKGEIKPGEKVRLTAADLT